MATENIQVTLLPELNAEGGYFLKQDQELLRELRAKCAREADAAYADAHRNHCFRCGTKSLVEIRRGNVMVDICVNQGCGALHLDPGELETFLEHGDVLKTLRKALHLFT